MLVENENERLKRMAPTTEQYKTIAFRGVTADGLPLISYIHNGEVITLFNRSEFARPGDPSRVNEWVMLQGERRQDAWPVYWPHQGPKVREALALENRPSPDAPNRLR